jgi:hypothetical protein
LLSAGKKVVVPINRFNRWITQNSHVLPLLAFLIPTLVRAVPEILIGPYITGFDTLGVYVPENLMWLHSGMNLGAFLATAPLFYSIFISVVAAGVSPIWVLKIISPLLLGFLGLTLYLYARKSLGWSPPKSIAPALLGTIYFVALRISWDMLRNELGLIFFFVVLALLTNIEKRSRKYYLILSLAMLAVVLTHQLVAVIMFGAITSTIIHKILRKHRIAAVNVFLALLPSILFFAIVYFGYATKYGFFDYSTNIGSPLANWTGFTSYQSMLTSEIGFFFYCYFLLLPLFLISIKGLRNLQLRSWLFFSFVLLLLPIASVSPFRWLLMFIYPLAFYVTDSFGRLKSIKWKHSLTIRRIAILYLVFLMVIPSFGYIVMTPEHPFVYFDPQNVNVFSNQFPSSMLQNTVSITDCKDTVNVIQWFKENLNSSSILLTHTVFNGWALLILNQDQVRNYGFDDPAKAIISVAQEGNKQIYLIWWINGQGWYGQPSVASSFHQIYQSGKIAIYHWVIDS